MAKVLVVDDSSIMRRNLSAILKKAGHTIVAEASNGELGFKEYEKYKPDLVTMDITMPVMDGIEAVKKIIDFDPEASIVMISALDQKFMVLTAIQCGARHYIIKPFSSEKVLDVIGEVLSSPKGKFSKRADSIDEAFSNNTGEPSHMLDDTINSLNNSIDNINSTIEKLDKEE